jgi:hypothetical protein
MAGTAAAVVAPSLQLYRRIGCRNASYTAAATAAVPAPLCTLELHGWQCSSGALGGWS